MMAGYAKPHGHRVHTSYDKVRGLTKADRLQVIGAQARVLGDLSEDDRPQFFSVVVSETVLRPAFAS
jgi:hypothetical protein